MMTLLRQGRWCCLLLALLLPLTGFAQGAAGKLYGQKIVIEANAGAMVKTASGDLAHWLEKITGQKYDIWMRRRRN